MKTKHMLAMAALAIAMTLSAGSVLAQNNDNNNNNGGQGRQRGNRGGFNGDPAQFQQQMLDRTKEQLEITDETEWNAIKPLVQKVMDARRTSLSEMARTLGGRTRGAGGGENTNQGDRAEA